MAAQGCQIMLSLVVDLILFNAFTSFGSGWECAFTIAMSCNEADSGLVTKNHDYFHPSEKFHLNLVSLQLQMKPILILRLASLQLKMKPILILQVVNNV